MMMLQGLGIRKDWRDIVGAGSPRPYNFTHTNPFKYAPSGKCKEMG